MFIYTKMVCFGFYPPAVFFYVFPYKPSHCMSYLLVKACQYFGNTWVFATIHSLYFLLSNVSLPCGWLVMMFCQLGEL